MVQMWDFITNFFTGMGDFWNWLNTPLYPELLGSFAPIHVIGVSGLMTILIFWIIKLVNPFS